MAKTKYDCSGWATKYGVKCFDGRTIAPDAFRDQDGTQVSLVWNHQHNDISNVLGHAVLEARPEGMYAYATFNEDTEQGRKAKALVQHHDITSFSIWANGLQYANGNRDSGVVSHGIIRELSLVLAGANPEAHIEPVLAHDGVGFENAEVVIYNDLGDISYESGEHEIMEHAAEDEKEDTKVAEEVKKPAGKTIGEVFEAMTEEQKTVVYALIGQALQDAKGEKDTDEEDEEVKHNVFDSGYRNDTEVLSHDAMQTIFTEAKRGRQTLKEATSDYLEHASLGYGIDDIETLFPEYQEVNTPPKFIDRDQSWVTTVMGSVKHLPFSRVKTSFADITADEARAKGYTKGKKKLEEVFTLLKRTTDPQTVYKKQKFDRDDVIDITDFDVVAWVKNEMRGKLNEELARAFMIGDGRSTASDDKISEEHIRPIVSDDELFAIHRDLSAEATDVATAAAAMIDDAVRSRKEYKGSGNPTLFTSEDILAEMLLMKDKDGYRMYKSETELATAMRVSKIVTVPLFEGFSRVDGADTKYLIGIIVNLADYSVGADKGGAVSMFDDFDIDYNQYKYLIETRCSAALTVPKSALVFETKSSLAT